MPCYEFYCEACSKAFEQIRPIDQRHNGVCPSCDTVSDSRLISLPAKSQIKDGISAISVPMAGGCGTQNCCGGMCQN